MKSIKKNFLLNSFYQLLTIITPLITTPVISRNLGAANIGLYSYNYSIASYFVLFIMLGLNNYGNRTIASVRDNKIRLSKTFEGIYLMQLFFGIIVLVAYVLYAFVISNHVIAKILTLHVISSVLDINWFFFGLEEFKITVTKNSVIKVLTTIFIIIMVKNNDDLLLYILIVTISTLLSQLCMWPSIKRHICFVKIYRKDVFQHIKPNIILFIPVVAISLYNIMDKIMLGVLTDMTEVGYYENSERIIRIPLVFVSSLGTVMLPRMTRLIANKEKEKSKEYISNSFKLTMFLSTSMCFGIMAVSDIFVPIFYGNGFLKCIVLFQILLPSCIFIAFANVIRTQYLIPMKKDITYIQSVFLGAIVNVVLNSLLIPFTKSIGASIATLISEICVCAFQTFSVRNEIDVRRYLFESMPYIIGGLLMYLTIINLTLPFDNPILLLTFKILLGIIIYLVILFISNVLFIKSKYKR